MSAIYYKVSTTKWILSKKTMRIKTDMGKTDPLPKYEV